MKIVKSLPKTQQIGIETRLGVFLKHSNRSDNFEEDQVDPNQGEPVATIIPCLDPDTPENQKIDFEVISTRVLLDEKILTF